MKLVQTRLIGFIAGSILTALAAILLTDISASKDKTDISDGNILPDIEAKQDPTPTPTPALLDTELGLANQVEPITDSQPNNTLATATPLVVAEEPPIEIEGSEQSAEIKHNTDEPKNLELFWGPFLSESRAQNFATSIENIITHPMELKRNENGYSIGFRYLDEDEKLRIKRAIQNKTGIDLGIETEQ